VYHHFGGHLFGGLVGLIHSNGDGFSILVGIVAAVIEHGGLVVELGGDDDRRTRKVDVV
jgi:hypothetical protein